MVIFWKDVPGFNGKYQLSTEGTVRRVYPSGKTRELQPFFKNNKRGGNRLVVNLTDEQGRKKECVFLTLMAKTFLGPPPTGCVPYHINGCKSENHIQNIAYINRKELGKKTGPRSRRRAVAKINEFGEVIDVYSSAREAGRQNYMSYQTVLDYCNGKNKGTFAPDGYAYAWDNSCVSMRNAIRKIELANGYMPKAKQTEFDFKMKENNL